MINMLPLCILQGGGFTTIITFDAREREECVTVPTTVVAADVLTFSIYLELFDEYGGRIVLRPSVATVVIMSEEMYNRRSIICVITWEAILTSISLEDYPTQMMCANIASLHFHFGDHCSLRVA